MPLLGLGLLPGDQMHKGLRSLLGRKHLKRKREGHNIDLILGPHSLAERTMVRTELDPPLKFIIYNNVKLR